MGSFFSTNDKKPNSSPIPSKPIAFGKEMSKQFPFDPKWKNLNHGSFGAYPLAVRKRFLELQDEAIARPDPFIRYTYPKLVDESRAALAHHLNAPVETIVMVQNATTGVNAVLRNLVWNPDGKDEILYFNTIYGACRQTIIYIVETSQCLLSSRAIDLSLPMTPTAITSLFEATIHASRSAGKRPVLALFDTIASMPGYVMPFASLTSICAASGILSLIDGAHGIGHIPLDLSVLDPDFFVSNCHKWLFVPPGTAVFYVPVRNQHLMRSTLPTSHCFVPVDGSKKLANPLGGIEKVPWVGQWEFVGTSDSAPYLCVREALRWRKEVAGGEEIIMAYCTELTKKGGKRVAEILGTEVLDDEEGAMTECALVNVRLPLTFRSNGKGELSEGSPGKVVKAGYRADAKQWIEQTLVQDYETFIAIFFFQDVWWTRLSGQIYLDMDDFEWAGRKLKEICERAGRGEFLEGVKEMEPTKKADSEVGE